MTVNKVVNVVDVSRPDGNSGESQESQVLGRGVVCTSVSKFRRVTKTKKIEVIGHSMAVDTKEECSEHNRCSLGRQSPDQI